MAKSVSGPKVVTRCHQSYFPTYSRLLVIFTDDDDDNYPISWYRADCANKVQYVRMKFRIHSDALHFISLQKRKKNWDKADDALMNVNCI